MERVQILVYQNRKGIRRYLKHCVELLRPLPGTSGPTKYYMVEKRGKTTMSIYVLSSVHALALGPSTTENDYKLE